MTTSNRFAHPSTPIVAEASVPKLFSTRAPDGSSFLGEHVAWIRGGREGQRVEGATMLRWRFVVLMLLLSAAPARVGAQDETAPAPDRRAEARRLLETAESHYAAGHHALAAQTWLEGYAVLVEIGNRMAPLALWNAGESLTHVPGREREARDTLQRFLDESTAITDDEGVRDDRSRALELIQDLEARAALARPSDDGGQAPSGPQPSDGGISPVGPIVLGIGAAILLAGAITGGLMIAENDALSGMCSEGVCPTAARPQAESVESLAVASDVLLIGGGAVAITGFVLLLVLRDGPPDEPPPVAAACGGEGCVVQLQGAF